MRLLQANIERRLWPLRHASRCCGKSKSGMGLVSCCTFASLLFWVVLLLLYAVIQLSTFQPKDAHAVVQQARIDSLLVGVTKQKQAKPAQPSHSSRTKPQMLHRKQNRTQNYGSALIETTEDAEATAADLQPPITDHQRPRDW